MNEAVSPSHRRFLCSFAASGLERQPFIPLSLLSLFALAWLAAPQILPAQSTAFTYQGRLDDAGTPANGNYDLTFTLFNAPSGGSAGAAPLTNLATPVSNGLFTVTLDFGTGVFLGANNWLEIAVRTNAAAAFVTLAPRQALTPSPYAIFAANAGTAWTALNANSISNVNSANIAQLNVLGTAAQATGTPVIFNGFLVGANVVFGGAGYATPPAVTINDSTGSGAVVVANILGGAVVSFTVQDAGHGYSSAATLTLGLPPSNAYQTFLGANYFTGVNTLSNPSNVFAGSFTGNGAGITNLNGGSLQPGTVSSQALDAATLELLTNRPAWQQGNGNLTNWSQLDTNVLSQVAASASWSHSATLFVDVNGNDATAAKGVLPWRTIQAALTNAVAGDVIRLGVGVFDAGPNTLDIPHNVSLVGQGVGLSEIDTSINSPVGAHAALVPGDNSYLAGFTLAQSKPRTNYCYLLGASVGDKTFTNALCFNIALDGETDGVYLINDGLVTLTIKNSKISTKWDLVVLSSMKQSSVSLDGVQLVVDSRGATNSDTTSIMAGSFVSIANGTVDYRNCSGSMYIENSGGGGNPDLRLVNANPALTDCLVRMVNCAFDFTCPATDSDGTLAYPFLEWPCDTVVDDNSLGGAAGTFNPSNASGNANCSFANVTCIYSNTVINFTLGRYLTNQIDHTVRQCRIVSEP